MAVEYIQCFIYYILTHPCVPLFIMISGAFLLNPEKQYTIKKLYTSNILRMVSTLLIWSIFYSACYCLLDYHGSAKLTFGDFLNHAVNSKGHMWFMYMIIGLYIVAPFLRKIVCDKKLTVYYLLLCFFLVFFCNTVKVFSWGKIFSEQILQKFDIFLVLGYSGYFVLGYYLFSVRLSSAIRKVIYLIGAVSFFGMIITFYSCHHTGICEIHSLYDKICMLSGCNTLPTLFETIAIFVFFQYSVTGEHYLPIAKQIITQTGKLTFGIYLVHIVVMEHLSIIGLSFETWHPLISIPVISVIVFLLSAGISFVLSKIPYANKFLL